MWKSYEYVGARTAHSRVFGVPTSEGYITVTITPYYGASGKKWPSFEEVEELVDDVVAERIEWLNNKYAMLQNLRTVLEGYPEIVKRAAIDEQMRVVAKARELVDKPLTVRHQSAWEDGYTIDPFAGWEIV